MKDLSYLKKAGSEKVKRAQLRSQAIIAVRPKDFYTILQKSKET